MLVRFTVEDILNHYRNMNMIANEPIRIGRNFYEKVKTFNGLGSLVTNHNSFQDEIKCGIKAGNWYSFVNVEEYGSIL